MLLKCTKKIKLISKSINPQRNMIATLENGMEDQHKKLELVTISTGETDNKECGLGRDDNSSEDDNEDGSKEDYGFEEDI